MKWEQYDILKEVPTGENDELGNPITTERIVGTIPARATAWTAEDVAILGRDVTQNQRKLLTPAPLHLFSGEVMLTHGASVYRVTAVKDYGRFRHLTVEEYKTWHA